ncbi:MAG TPA: hypothetical protein VFL76_11385 [Edaphocola sp.]|nr:hypothetical protein [Edaphocola sp.]
MTAVLLLAPAFPRHQTVEEKPVVLWLQDGSSSMKMALGKDSVLFREKTEAIFDHKDKHYKILPLSFGAQLKNGNDFRYRAAVTNISNALQSAVQRYRDQNIGAIILSSDGNYNMGSNPLYALPENNIPVYSIGLGDSTRSRDMQITFTRANKTVALGNQFELLASIRAQKLNGRAGIIKVTHKGKTIAQQNFNVKGNQDHQTFRFYLPATEKGIQAYQVVLPPLDGEVNARNNQKTVFVEVLEKTVKIVVAAHAPHPDIAAIREALANHPEYKLSVMYGADVPDQVTGADLLITHDLPNEDGAPMPEHAGIPSWNILGPHTDLKTFSKDQDLLQVQPQKGIDNALPQLNPQFGLFALPEDIREIVAQMPPLLSPNGQYKIRQGQVLFKKQNSTDPLWIFHAGTYPEAILCGSGIWRWRLYSFKAFRQSGSVDALIQRTVGLLTGQSDKKQFQIILPQHQFQDLEPVQVNASLKDAGGMLINQPRADLVIRDSNDRLVRNLVFRPSGKSYQCNAGALPAGSYTAEATVSFDGRKLVDRDKFIVLKTALERMAQNSDYDILYKLSANSKGRFYTLGNMQDIQKALDQNAGFKPVIREESHEVRWVDLKWYFFIILVAAAAEWFLRKYWGI